MKVLSDSACVFVFLSSIISIFEGGKIGVEK